MYQHSKCIKNPSNYSFSNLLLLRLDLDLDGEHHQVPNRYWLPDSFYTMSAEYIRGHNKIVQKHHNLVFDIPQGNHCLYISILACEPDPQTKTVTETVQKNQ